MNNASRTVVSVIFCALAALAFAACFESTVSDFMASDEVQDYIDRNRVTLVDNTDDKHLRAGNGYIYGLETDLYYVMEELDEDDDPVDVHFIFGNGMRNTDFGYIGRVTGGRINGLDNDHTYIVSAAGSLYANGTELTYFDLIPGMPTNTVPPTAPKKSTVINGAITIPYSTETQYLDLTTAINPAIDPDKDYEIMMVPVSPNNRALAWNYTSRASAYNTAGGSITNINSTPFTVPSLYSSKSAGIYQFRAATSPTYLEGMSLIELWDEDTTTTADYIIIERNNTGKIIFFKVLQVKIVSPTAITLNITINFTADGTPAVSGPPISYSQTDPGVIINLTITNPGLYSNIKWYFNGVDLSKDGIFNLSLSIADDPYNFTIVGDHEITLEVTRNGIPYSVSIPVEVTN